MSKSKRLLSVFIALAILVSSLFIGTVAATGEILTFTNTFDEDGIYYQSSTNGDQSATLRRLGEDSSFPTNYYSAVSHWGATVEECTVDAEAGRAAHFDGAKSYNSRWPSAFRLYNTASSNEYFKASANTSYDIKLKYYVGTKPDRTVNLQVRQRSDCSGSVYQSYDSFSSDYVLVSDLAVVTDVTNGWIETSGRFTVGATDTWIQISAASADASNANNVDIWVDDITVAECADLTVHNYDGANDGTVPVSSMTTVAQLQIPQRDGYIFRGVYADAEYSVKIDTTALAASYDEVWYKWAKLSDGEYYAGFEDYTVPTNVVSYDSAVSEITGGNTYAGGYMMETVIEADGIAAFELRDKSAFKVNKDTEYTVSFAYKATADAELYVGLANSGDVPGTAYAIEGGALAKSDEWKIASITLTLDNGTVDGYSLAMLLNSEQGATVCIDDVYVTFPFDDTTVNMPSIDGFSADWYPALDAFNPKGEVKPVEVVEIWNGSEIAPADSDGDGVFEISSGAELAYIIVNGGAADAKYILTKDIYLNDIEKINWATGEPAEGYTPNKWYANEAFQGTIDGNGHTVYGLYYNNEGSKSWGMYGVGLIPKVDFDTTVSVTGLGVDKAYINYPNGAAAFVGCGGTNNSAATNRAIVNIDRCYVGADVTINACNAGAFRGVNRGCNITLTNSYSLASTTGTYYGLVANETWDSSETVINCYNANGPISSHASASVANSYQTVAGKFITANVVAADKMQGTDVFLADDKMLFFNIDGAFVATESYPVPAVFAGVEEIEMDVWDGTVAESFAGGTGTETDPYLIETPEQLALAITTGGVDEANYNAYYKLTADIYLNNINAIRWSDGVVASSYNAKTWYNQAQLFVGNIDGDGHYVYGLYRKDNPSSFTSYQNYGTGLVPRVPDGETVTISNLAVDKSYVRVESGASAFVGTSYKGIININSCLAGKDVTVSGGDSGAFIGYAPCNATLATLNNCYSFATTVANINYGLVGRAYHTWLRANYCYNANGPITSYTQTQYSTWYELDTSYQTVDGGTGGSRSSYATTISSDKMVGLDVLTAEDKMPNLAVPEVYVATESYPVLKLFADVVSSNDSEDTGEDEESGTTSTPSDITIWDGTSTAPTQGTGTEDDPWLITNGAELHYVIRTYGGAGEYYKLTNDIYLNDITKFNWNIGVPSSEYKFNGWFGYWETPAFSGHIDGDNHVIYGLYFDQETTKETTLSATGAGLIPQIAANAEASVKNLGIDNMYLHYESCVGGFVGSALSGSTLAIENCFLGEDVVLEAPHTGAFCAVSVDATTTVENCYSLATQNYHSTEGTNGLVSQHWFGEAGTITVKNSYNGNGPIISYVREATVVLENCFQTKAGQYNTGVITLSADDMKGADVTTNSQKMKALAAAGFVPTERTFADFDYLTYLPTGTVIDPSLEILFFDNYMAPISESKVLYGDKMIRGAYVKFVAEPDETLVKIPASVADKVHAGSSAEIVASRGDDYFFGIEFDIASDMISTESVGSVNYIFITDLHYGYDSAKDQASLLKQVAYVTKMANENDNIDFICLGGDITQGNASTKEGQKTLLNTILTPLLDCEKPVFVLAGNHDDNAYSKFNVEKVLNNQDWNDSVIDFVVNRSTADGDVADIQVVQDTDLSNGPSKYYYYDLENKKTRVICLDAINYPYAWNEATGTWDLAVKNASATDDRAKYYNGYNTWGYSTKQIEWLAEVAMTCDEGWDYVFLSHMGIDGSTNSIDVLNGQQLRDIIKAYQFKTAYSFTDTDLTDGEDDSISVDFTDTTGRILVYQFGHNHYEKEIYSEDIDLWQIITSSTNPGNYKNVTQTLKTETELHFDVMFADRNDIYKHNIGSGSDNRLINTPVTVDGDVNRDNNVDIFDLVALNNGKALPSKAADVDKDSKISVIIDSAALRKLIIKAK